MRKFVAIDVETTGFSPEGDSIVQVAAIKFNQQGKVLDTYEKKFWPEKDYIPYGAFKVHGISLDDVRGEPMYNDKSSSAIKNFCNRCELVGHNIKKFDLPFLKFECVKIIATHDTLEFAREEWTGRVSLEACCKKAKLILESGKYHDAMSDSRQTMRLFLYLKFREEQTRLFQDSKQEIKYRALKVDVSLARTNPSPDYPKDRVSILGEKDLVIPFDAPEEYHWWKEAATIKTFIGQDIYVIINEYGKEEEKVRKKYKTEPKYPDIKFKSWEEINELAQKEKLQLTKSVN